MGGKQRWTAEEEQALREGVDRYGPGKWRTIQKDPDFGPSLTARSNVDLKDKWRNLTADPSQKSSSKHRARRDGAAARPGSRGRRQGRRKQTASPSPPLERRETKRTSARRRAPMEAAAAAAVLMATCSDRSGTDSRQHPNGPKPEDMVIASIISLSEPNGSPSEDIIEWVQEQYRVGSGSARKIQATLQHMVNSGRLEVSPEAAAPRYQLATLKYAPAAAAAGLPPASGMAAGSMHGGFDQSAFEAAQSAAVAVAEAAEAAARADRLNDAASLFELAAQQAETESPHGWSMLGTKQESSR